MILSQLSYVLLAALVTSYATLGGLDLGVGIVHLVIPRTREERRQSLATVGLACHGHLLWLLAAGLVLATAFPRAWRPLADGFGTLGIVLAIALTLRGIVHRLGARADRAGTLAHHIFGGLSVLVAFLFGLFAGNVVRGLSVGPQGRFDGGLLSVLNPFSLFMGAATVALFALHGTCWLAFRTVGRLSFRATTAAIFGWAAFVALYVDTTLWIPSEAPWIFVRHRMALWAWAPVPPLAVAATALPLLLRQGRERAALVASSTIVASTSAVLAVAAFPFLLICRNRPFQSLTAYNAAAAPATLRALLGAALLFLPALAAFSFLLMRRMRGQVQPRGARHSLV